MYYDGLVDLSLSSNKSKSNNSNGSAGAAGFPMYNQMNNQNNPQKQAKLDNIVNWWIEISWKKKLDKNLPHVYIYIIRI